MESTSFDKTKILIMGFNRMHFKQISIYHDIVQCERCYLIGYEGTPRDDELGNDNDAPIAAENTIIASPKRELDDVLAVIPPKYFIAYNPIPNRNKFCKEMKAHYNATIGMAKKAYNYIRDIRARPVEGIKSITDNQDVKCGAYQYIQPIQNDSELNENTIEEIVFSDDITDNLVTEQSITSQESSIVNTDKNNYIHSEEIERLIEEEEDTTDVMDKYEVLPFLATKNVYIDEQFIKSWIKYVFPRFNDEDIMYYWFEYMTAIQMIHGYIKQYICKENGSFLCGIINYELHDIYNNILYGIICCDINIKHQNGNKYRYKLSTLMTKEEIEREFGINGYDLPTKSRIHYNLMNKLVLKQKILKQDLYRIKWENLKIFKSLNSNKSVTISKDIMTEYMNISIEERNLIPIMVHDGYNIYYYEIEWVLIIYIIDHKCYIGVSFKYNTLNNLFIATSIYLDKFEIQRKHKLIGLKHDHSQNIPSFSLNELKIIDVDNNNNNNTLKYKEWTHSQHNEQYLFPIEQQQYL